VEKNWAWWHLPVIPATEDCLLGWPGQKARTYVKNNQKKNAGAGAQAEHLPSKCKALISNTNVEKKNVYTQLF
jgi:hypothetical protein